MRIMVFFDLPVDTADDRRQYSKFHKLLIKEGFIMMQKSVYSKLTLNSSISTLVKNKLKKERPKNGLVQLLTITEKQFASIENIIGEQQSHILDSTNRMVIL
ncbi:MAG: CRISPR-associated endonuclease Cas2 [Desulfitobacteriaceae bacterium]